MGKNELQYNARREFAVDQVYQKLTQGIDDLPAEAAVDGLLYGADSLRAGVDQLIEKIYKGAEQQQGVVLNDAEDIDSMIKEIWKVVKKAEKEVNWK